MPRPLAGESARVLPGRGSVQTKPAPLGPLDDAPMDLVVGQKSIVGSAIGRIRSNQARYRMVLASS